MPAYVVTPSTYSSTVITLDDTSDVPPYEQVRDQVAAQVGDGTLVAGHRMPTVRALAADLGLAVNTVAKAYRELEQAGVIETRGRAGSFVTGDGVERRARAAARAYLAETRTLGLSDADAVALVNAQTGY
jgi:DNA-binding transcriptional regulator YhcF (GntR family)